MLIITHDCTHIHAEITFTIGSDAIIVASEGQRVIRIIKFLKTGNTSLTYNVTLEINALTSSASNKHSI